MSKGLPPPVSIKSTNKRLWKEIEHLRREIEEQQDFINRHRKRLESLRGSINQIYQMTFNI